MNQTYTSRQASSSTSGGKDSVLILRFQTAKLWAISSPQGATPRVVSFHCPTCRDPERSRLLEIVLKEAPTDTGTFGYTKLREGAVRVLLHVTPPQVEEVLASFGREDNWQTLRSIWAFSEKPHEGEKPGRKGQTSESTHPGSH